MGDTFRSFSDFYPFYLGEHANPTNRRLHFVGTTLVLALSVAAAALGQPRLLIALPFAGYGFAWVGHFIVEKNRPATFKHPIWSLMGDFRMYADMLTGKVSWTETLRPPA
jgi:hypothetical protein